MLGSRERAITPIRHADAAAAFLGADFFGIDFLANSTISSKMAGSWMASSLNVLRLSSTLATVNPQMKFE